MDWLTNDREFSDTEAAANDGDRVDEDATVPYSFCVEPCLDPDIGGVGITMDGQPACYACSLT